MMRRTRRILSIIAIGAAFAAVGRLPSPRAAAIQGASGVKVVCDRWPDYSGMRQFSLDAIRLMEARTDEEKALAVWRFIRMWSAWTDGNNPREPALKDTYIDDPVKVLNVYGAHWCDGLARIMEVAWRALGLRAEKLYRSGHTQADVYWRDTDGVSRWHLMDLSQGWYVNDRSAGHLATPDEIAADYSLIFRPARGPIPRNPNYWGMHNWVHAPHLAWPAHSVELRLRRNEGMTRYWGNLSLPYQDNYAAKGQLDFEHGPYPVTYGNGVLQYTPDLASESYKQDLWTAAQNLNSRSADGLGPNMHPTAISAPAVAIFEIKSPYIISDASVSGSFFRKSTSDAASLSISTDLGKTWKTVWQPSGTGTISLSAVPIADKFDIYAAVPAGLISPFGRYQYLLKVEMAAYSSVSDVGFDTLAVTTTTQHNIFSLPQLWPGTNNIAVNGEVGSDVSLKITYVWQDPMGAERRNVAVAETTPFIYAINTAGQTWNDVLTKRISVEAVPRIGRGNYVEVREQQPAALTTLKPAQVFATDRIVGTTQPSALKTAAAYIADLSYGNRQVAALSGLIVLKDRSCLSAVQKVAYESIAFPNKDLAVQALHHVGGASSNPVLLEMVKKNPAVIWKYDAANKFVELGHWYQISALIGHMLAEDHDPSAAPYLAAVLDNMIANNDHSWETQSGIIRALGRVGARDTAASIRPFLNREVDVAATAAWALGELQDGASVEALKTAFYRTSYMVLKMRSAEALAKLGCRDIYTDLCKLLSSSDEDLRATAAEALGKLGNTSATANLQAMIDKETFPWVKEIAQGSLRVLSGNAPAPPSGLKLINQ